MKNNNLVYIAVEYLHPHPNNPRKDLGDLTELAESIKQSGIMQNLTVVERADALYDEMRSRAAEFVKTYRSKKEHYDVLVAHLFDAVVSGKLTAHYEVYRTAEALGWVMPEGARTWEDETRMAAETYIAECYEKDKPRVILLTMWYMLPERKPFSLRYNERKLELTNGHGWYRLFEILTDVGYNVSDEEWSIIGGSHPIFSEEVPL